MDLTGRDMNIVYDPAKAVGPVSRTADITKDRALLNWQPKVSFDEGLRRTYSWIQKRLEEKFQI